MSSDGPGLFHVRPHREARRGLATSPRTGSWTSPGPAVDPFPVWRFVSSEMTATRLSPAMLERCFCEDRISCRGTSATPDLTAETLREGWLRTGDLGRLDEEGYLFLEGRKKDIVKCAGQRISPAEIEAVLATFPGVAEAAVVGGSRCAARRVDRGPFWL